MCWTGYRTTARSVVSIVGVRQRLPSLVRHVSRPFTFSDAALLSECKRHSILCMLQRTTSGTWTASWS